jgi:anaerobic ribonucleoside-triphosphate reductase activating protein
MRFQMAGRIKHSLVNGPGVRYVLFFQGCTHGCPGCQNPETWDRAGGHEADTGEILREISRIRYLDGITLSGGDPLLQPEAAAEIARGAKALGLSVWCYTGWTWENLPAASRQALACIDVLVDGPFILARKDGRAKWRGSSNQRLIDVKKSLQEGRAVSIADEEV